MTWHNVTEKEYETAQAAGRKAAEREFRAYSIRYLRDRDAIEVMTARDGGFVIPRQLVASLRGANEADLVKMELWPDGSLIEIEHLDIHISVDGMLRAALPALVPGPVVAAMFAAAGGAAKSAAKARSSRQNGKKGGRPKKTAASV